MSERKVIMGPYNLGWIKAANRSLNHKAFLKYLPKVDFESLIYSSLSQCGASKLEVNPIFIDKIPRSKFIRSRFKIAPKKNTKIRNLVYLTFYNILKRKDKMEEIHAIVNFIADMAIKLLSVTDRENRIVVYQTDNINKELISARIDSYVETRLIKEGLKS